MKLEQFKEIADENLKDLIVDERMVQRVHQSISSTSAVSKRKLPRNAFALAAACIAVMLVSGGVLLGTTNVLPGFGSAVASDEPAPAKLVQPTNSASTLSATLETSQFIDGSTLSYGVSEVGEYSEGYAPALATNGLYGYVNENKIWVVKAMYDEAQPVSDGKALVLIQETEYFIEIP